MKYIILSLLVSLSLSVQAQKKVLFVMSAAKDLPLKNGKTYTNTGVFLSEFYLAWKDITDRGYVVDFATPDGQVSSIDKESLEEKYWKGRVGLIPEAVLFVRSDSSFNHPKTLQEVSDQWRDYDGMVIPGGQGLMVDLIRDPLVAGLLMNFASQNKCIGLICHAPALLTTMPQANNPLSGYRVNSVTGTEELFIETFVMKGRPLNRKIGRQLKQLGFQYKRGRPGKNFAVRDRNLVTSQNPFSNEAFSKLFLEALAEFRQSSLQ